MATPRPQTESDLLVVGGGVVGVAAALDAARRGLSVDLLERGPLVPASGSSKGTARIIVPAAYPDESYLERGLAALALWRRIEAEIGRDLLVETGAISVGPFAADESPALKKAGLDAELITSQGARRDLGIELDDERPILFQPHAGIMLADQAHRALVELAGAQGARLHAGEHVLALREHGGRVEVESERRRWRSAAVIVAAGPWSRALVAGAGIDLSITVSRQSVVHLPLAEPGDRPVALMEYDGEEPYALWDPPYGLKAAFHARGPEADPNEEAASVDPDAISRLRAWAERRFPDATSGVAGSETCLYTNTPDERFLFERHGRVAVVSACNGQGFQFAPETGRRAVNLALEPLEVATG